MPAHSWQLQLLTTRRNCIALMLSLVSYVQFEATSLSLVLTWSWSSLSHAIPSTVCSAQLVHAVHPAVTKLHLVWLAVSRVPLTEGALATSAILPTNAAPSMGDSASQNWSTQSMCIICSDYDRHARCRCFLSHGHTVACVAPRLRSPVRICPALGVSS